MLVQFSVENYKSIRDEVVINFRSEKKQEDRKWAVSAVDKGFPIYRCIALIGPNASGKSNIIEALFFALKFIDRTISRKDNAEISVDVFGFSKECSNVPTSFEFIFIYKGIKYVYGFSVNKKEVIEEYLMGYFTAKAKTIFERTKGQKFNFKGNQTKQQKEISQKTNANRLYMPVAAEWGYEQAKNVMEWFNLMVRQYADFNITSILEEIINDKKRKALFIEELQRADFNIADIKLEKELLDKKAAELFSKLFPGFLESRDELIENKSYKNKVVVVHRNDQGECFEIDMTEDSDGTIDIIKNMAEIIHIGKEGGLMLEDELGASYHTKLTQHFLNIIGSDSINSGNAQLLFSSHDTKLLNFLHADQIYLVDKDETGATFVTLLSDYQIRPDTNIELGYLKGRFGGMPYMKG